jgi:hypothetical protein
LSDLKVTSLQVKNVSSKIRVRMRNRSCATRNHHFDDCISPICLFPEIIIRFSTCNIQFLSLVAIYCFNFYLSSFSLEVLLNLYGFCTLLCKLISSKNSFYRFYLYKLFTNEDYVISDLISV